MNEALRDGSSYLAAAQALNWGEESDDGVAPNVAAVKRIMELDTAPIPLLARDGSSSLSRRAKEGSSSLTRASAALTHGLGSVGEVLTTGSISDKKKAGVALAEEQAGAVAQEQAGAGAQEQAGADAGDPAAGLKPLGRSASTRAPVAEAI